MIKIIFIFALLLLSFGIFQNLTSLAKLFRRYVFDGADSRAPYIMALLFCISILHFELVVFMFTTVISPLLIYITQISSFLWSSYLLKSRLSGYVTMSISKVQKDIIYIIYSFIFWIVVFVLAMNFKNNVFNPVEFATMNHLELFVEYLNHNFFCEINWLFIPLSLLPLLLVWFDYKERRWNHVKLDCLFIIPFITILLNMLNIQNIWILLIFDIAYLFFPVFFLQKELKSIIKHSSRIDSRVGEINSILKEIAYICPACPGHCQIHNEGCKMSKKQKYQLKYIAKMILEDPQLGDIVMRKHFFKRKQYQNVYDKLNYQIASEKSKLNK
jgi:hypothetical protein